MATITESDVIAGIYIVEPKKYGDERGYFIENYRREWFPQGREMIQGNRGNRIAGCLVGLHYHLHQADYWVVPFPRPAVLHDCVRARPPTERPRCPARSTAVRTTTSACSSHPASPTASPLTDMAITYLVDVTTTPRTRTGCRNDPVIDADWGLTDLSSRLAPGQPRVPRSPDVWPHYQLRP